MVAQTIATATAFPIRATLSMTHRLIAMAMASWISVKSMMAVQMTAMQMDFLILATLQMAQVTT